MTRFAVFTLLAVSSFLSVAIGPAEALDPKAFVKSTIDSHPVVIFSKSYCPYCRRAKQVFKGLGVTPFVVELDQREDGQEIQAAVAAFIGRRTVPQVFVKGQHIGGSDDTVESFESGRLAELVSGVETHEL